MRPCRRNPVVGCGAQVVTEGTADDVDRAAKAARAAFPASSALSGKERGEYLQKAAALIQERLDDFTALVSRDMGMPLGFAKPIQIGMPLANLAAFAELAATYDIDAHEVGNSLIVREPVDVVGAITPWNFPLHQVVLKVGGALAAGCTVVLEPTEVAPLATYALTDIVDEIGLPAGVFNLVSGFGPVVGEAIAGHPEVDMVSFTGSTRADKVDEAAAIAAQVAQNYSVGDRTAATSVLGPLVNSNQLKRVRGYIEQGIAEGAQAVLDGRETGQESGYFVGPTVFSGVTKDMTIAKEEILGPVLSIIGYRDEDDAVRIANATEYGLAAGIWSGHQDRADRVARQLRAGQVEVNGGRFDTNAPFGGYKQSGIGREAGAGGCAARAWLTSLWTRQPRTGAERNWPHAEPNP
ncbi:aldehyde dehydrogenase family protein [Rhodococcus opacus]|uniref:aldehyde dehydrogenase family protein n=1 Tax=Rhodococcus opacus TaxID=37919 RepID=UPI001FF4B8E6|nr:aldehyde dehydrogenase family protein [Rhodococcus opacus]UOT07707.1 aldehyde dehydrogenase family protein [Rhodococcus opacus]